MEEIGKLTMKVMQHVIVMFSDANDKDPRPRRKNLKSNLNRLKKDLSSTDLRVVFFARLFLTLCHLDDRMYFVLSLLQGFLITYKKRFSLGKSDRLMTAFRYVYSFRFQNKK